MLLHWQLLRSGLGYRIQSFPKVQGVPILNVFFYHSEPYRLIVNVVQAETFAVTLRVINNADHCHCININFQDNKEKWLQVNIQLKINLNRHEQIQIQWLFFLGFANSRTFEHAKPECRKNSTAFVVEMRRLRKQQTVFAVVRTICWSSATGGLH